MSEADKAQHAHYNNDDDPERSSYPPQPSQPIPRGLDSNERPVTRGYDVMGVVLTPNPRPFVGNFALDCQVPNKLLDMCPNRTDREFTYMRYTAATCDPSDFKESGFSLRQEYYDPPRRTELLIGITMHDEDEVLFCRTMHSVMKNIAHLCERIRSKTWGAGSWRRVVVCIISDGRARINSRTLSVIATMGAYQEGVAITKLVNRDITAHIYEYTTQISVNPSLEIEGSARGTVPVQTIFCLKEKSQGKVNSHRWFFNAFGTVLHPNICVLLDAGARPGPTSIYHIWKAFDINSSLGGACGEIAAYKGPFWMNLFNPLVASQDFEYKMCHILERSLGSIFGYITVLPSAFAGYRFIALQNDRRGEGPLQKYFSFEGRQWSSGSNFNSIMDLPQDHTLSWELVSKRGCSWLVRYVKSAYAETPVPDRLPELLLQHRQRLNGSFFAAAHSVVHFYDIYRSGHSFIRKAWLHVEMLFQVVNLAFTWFSLANFYITFAILTESLEDPSFNLPSIQNRILNCVYLALVFGSFCVSLLNRPRHFKAFYIVASVGFGIIMVYMIVALILLGVKGIDTLVGGREGTLSTVELFMNPIFRNVVLGLAATVGLCVATSLVFFEARHLVTSVVQYVLLVPFYVNVLNVYAFTNFVHNISQVGNGNHRFRDCPPPPLVATDIGDVDQHYEDALIVLQTKVRIPQNENAHQELCDTDFGATVLLAWVITNSILAVAITSTNPKAAIAGANASLAGYMSFLIYWLALLAVVKFVGSTIYMMIRLFSGE